mgnify:FL=1
MSLPSTPPTGERVAGIPAPPHPASDPDPTVSQPTAVETTSPEGDVSETEEKSSRRRRLPWEVTTPSRRQRVARAVVIASVGFFAFVGVWRVFVAPTRAPEAQAPVELPQSWGIDTTAAASVAERVARDYVSVGDGTARTAALSQTWASAGSAGWDGTGKLSVTDSYVASTTVEGERVNVLVAVEVTTPPEAKTQTQGWVGVLVPIANPTTTPSVAGPPALVGLPAAPTSSNAAIAHETDQELTDTTRADIEAFVRAWPGGDVDALVAPGGTVDAPALSGASAKVTSWRVYAGSSESRQGTMSVAWKLGDATLTSQYTVTIVPVKAHDATRWQIFSITTTN